MQLIALFIVGLIGGLYCAAQYTGVAARLRRDPSMSRLAPQLLFNAGRVAAYAMLGALAGAVGGYVVVRQAGLPAAALDPRMVPLLAGALMLLIGQRLYGAPWTLQARGTTSLQAIAPTPLRRRDWLTPFGIGAVGGLIPCPFAYALLPLAALSASPGAGAQIMLAVGVGTVPAMLLSGLAGNESAPDWSRRGVMLAANLVFVLGLVIVTTAALPSMS
jgi:sulfite exporter TauE/SafE